MRKFLCGVPKGQCLGSETPVCRGLGFSVKIHSSTKEAFACYSAWLRFLGYTQIGSREFSPPDGGPVLVLSKKSKFGAPLRRGKGGEGIKSKRLCPKRANSVCGGTIVSC